MESFIRLQSLIGSKKFNKLQNAHVAIFGIGGVGGYVAEGLARCGIKYLDLYDFDDVSISNINRQIIALNSSVGQKKVELMKNRILDINPRAVVKTFDIKVDKDTINNIDVKGLDYIVDAIDMVTSKLLLIELAKKNNINIISCMGTGNKLDPTKLEITDISKTSICPLARVIRKLLKQKNIAKLDVLYSKEQPLKKVEDIVGDERTPASSFFVPSVAGIMIAQKIYVNLLESYGTE